MRYDWNDLLLAFLHDPPDKAVDIQGHETRATEYASSALNREVTHAELHGSGRSEDRQAAIAERLPLPSGSMCRVGPQAGRLLVRHSLSGAEVWLEGCQVDEHGVARVIGDIADGITDARARYLALWRLLPERLAQLASWYAWLPADTRVPDHTIWHHLDTTAGLYPAYQNADNAAFLSFWIGPVQEFVAAARSVRDLWSGSYILSWLVFHGMLPVIEELGPTAIVYPYLRGTPLMDWWLRKADGDGLAEKVPEPDAAALQAPVLPNRFLAVVPYGAEGKDAAELAATCEQSCREAWGKLSDEVRDRLGSELRDLLEQQEPNTAHRDGRWPDTWAKRWRKQAASFFDIRTAILPWRGATEKVVADLLGGKDFAEVFPEAGRVRALADCIPPDARPGYGQNQAGLWQARVELSARLMEAKKAIRHVPPYIYVRPEHSAHHRFAPKCTLMGTYEQIGPEELHASREFWEQAASKASVDGIRLRKRERLCAIALVKRFAPAVLSEKLGLRTRQLRYHDTATIAAAEWLKEAKLDPSDCDSWSGNWLHWTKRETEDPDIEQPSPACWEKILAAKNRMDAAGKGFSPPSYYAVIQMDADNMGGWLRGERTREVREAYHPDIVRYFEGVGGAADKLAARRPVSPAFHAAISEALTNFAVRVVPTIVSKYFGTVVYAGGDDVLVLLPARAAVACARELYLGFRGDPSANNGARPGFYRDGNRELLVMGPKATLSAGIALVHYKDDLRFALQTARSAEKKAKEKGRNALVLTLCRRSGEQTSAFCPWDYAERVMAWQEAFFKGASDRWAYHISAEAETLAALERGAMRAEARRLFARAEGPTLRLLTGAEKAEDAGEHFLKWLDAFLDALVSPCRQLSNGRPCFDDGAAFREFITLVQSASFIARVAKGGEV